MNNQQTHLQRAKEEARKYKEKHGDFYTALSDKQLDEIVTSTYLQAVEYENKRVLDIVRGMTDEIEKYWNQEAWENYFEDQGYKFGPRDFIQSLKQTKDV